MKNPWVIIGVLAAVLIVGSVWYSGSVNEVNNEDVDLTKTYIKGSEDAPVRLVEYSDFQCPACGAWHPLVKEILSNYDSTEVAFEYQHFPLNFHPLAEPAARAVEAAGQQDKFYEYHDLIFENQNVWSNSPNPSALFVTYAEQLDLDIEKFERHMKSSALTQKIKDSFKKGVSAGVSGTPTFFVNGKKIDFGPTATTEQAVNRLHQEITEILKTDDDDQDMELELPVVEADIEVN